MLAGLLEAARLSVPDDVAALLSERGTSLGAESVTIYLADQEQYVLVPVPTTDDVAEPLNIDTTLAGRCYQRLQQQEASDGRQVWVPILDGLERLGVLKLEFPDRDARPADNLLHTFAAMTAEIVLVKGAYGDLFTQVRRRKPMSVAGEITWNLMPPLTFGTERLVISCVLAPAYDVGGDSFDYAVDDTTARIAIFDAMGHGLQAGLLATVAIAAYRHARRERRSLLEMVHAIDVALADNFEGSQFVTAILAELDLASGRLVWHSAGHPLPILIRRAHVVGLPHARTGVPLGLGTLRPDERHVEKVTLEPADRILFHSDGVVEARDREGRFFGTDRLIDLINRESAAGHPAPETMRRLMHGILDHQHGVLQDDATTVLVEWKSRGEQRITP